MAVTSTQSTCFNPLSLDAINFLLADVRGGLGPRGVGTSMAAGPPAAAA